MDLDEGFEAVAKLEEVPDEGTFGVIKATGEPVCLIRQGGRITAVSDTCTHQEFAISLGDVLSDGTIQCAWHGARFDCTSGAVRQGPATEPLPIYAVRVEGDTVLVGALQPRTAEGYAPAEALIGEDQSS